MEIPGCFFEDSEFDEPRNRRERSGEPYKAKQCEPQWFCEDLNSDDPVEILTTMKFRGDLAYRHEDFERALREYKSCFGVLPPSNAAMRRDIQESQARCLIGLGRFHDALEVTETLKNSVSSTDHLTCTLNLQTTICFNLGNLHQSVSCLQQLIALHPFNPWFWKRLADMYMRLFLTTDCSVTSYDSNTCKLCVEKTLLNEDCSTANEEMHGGDLCLFQLSVTDEDTSDCDDHATQQRLVNRSCHKCSLLKHCTNREELRINSCASFIRASLLLQFIQPQQASFVLENNLKTQKEIEEHLKDFGLEQESRTLITDIMGEDLSPERIREDSQIDPKTTVALTSFIIPSDLEFKEKWFKKISPFLLSSISRYRDQKLHL
ncbi:uncharacterized protein C8orf76 homolog [Discoglossus pictus]